MVEESNKSVEYILCGCGCGQKLYPFDSRGRPRRQIKGHSMKGKKPSQEHIQKLSEVRKQIFLGENNPFYGKKHSEETRKHWSKIRKGQQTNELHPMWKDNNVKYDGLHKWIRRHFPKPDLCPMCKEIQPREVACITGIYNREFKNWAWLCTKCHKLFDNIIERNLWKNKK